VGRGRRGISVKGTTYQRLKNHCDAEGRSMSGWLEDVIAEKMDALGIPVPEVVDPPTPKRNRTDEIISQHFSW